MPSTDFNKLSKELSGSTGIFGSLLLFVVIALVAILLFWASVTELDNVTRGQGKIVSSLQNHLPRQLWTPREYVHHHIERNPFEYFP